MYDNALGMYNMYLETYSDQYMALSKRKLVTNMILLICFLKDTIMKTGLKMKDWLMQHEKVIQINL